MKALTDTVYSVILIGVFRQSECPCLSASSDAVRRFFCRNRRRALSSVHPRSPKRTSLATAHVQPTDRWQTWVSWRVYLSSSYQAAREALSLVLSNIHPQGGSRATITNQYLADDGIESRQQTTNATPHHSTPLHSTTVAV